MKKYLYPIVINKIRPYLKYWFLFGKTFAELVSLVSQTLPLTLNNTLELKFEKFQPEGATEQDGTPTPETPVEIKNVEGKNFFDITNVNGIFPSSLNYFTQNDKLSLKANTTTGAQTVNYIFYNLNKNKNYNISYKAKKINGTERLRCLIRGIEGGVSTNLYILDQVSPSINTEYTFSQALTGYDTYQLLFYNATSSTVALGEETEYYDIMFEKGSVATPYVPYNSIEFKVQNKNLFNINGDVNTKYDGTTSTNNTVSGNDLITITNGGSTHPYGQKIYVGTGNTVILSTILKNIVYDTTPNSNTTVAYLSIYNYGTLDNRVGRGIKYSEIGQKISISFTATTDYILVGFSRGGSATTVTSATFTDIQVEKGSVATDFVEHKEQTCLFTFEEGQYLAEGGYLADDGIHKVRKQILINGSEDWKSVGTAGQYYGYYLLISDMKSVGLDVSDNFKCDKIHYVRSSSYAEEGGGYIIQRNFVIFSSETSVNDFKAWLNNNNMKFQYELAEEEITAYTQTQQTQWNAIKNLYGYNEQTNISCTGSEVMPKLSIDYYVKGGE